MTAVADYDDATELVRRAGCPAWCGGHAVDEHPDVEHYGVVGEVCLPDSGRLSTGNYVVANSQPGTDSAPTFVSLLAPAAEVHLSAAEARALAALLLAATEQGDVE